MPPQEAIKARMQVAISITLMVVGIAILAGPLIKADMSPADGLQKIAAGWIGAVIGYWLD